MLCRDIGTGCSHACAFQLYNDGPIVKVRQTTNYVTFNRNLLPDIGALSDSGTFTVARTGLYWLHFETYADDNQRANYSLVDGKHECLTQLTSNCPKFNMPVLSRDVLRSLNETEQLYTTSAYPAHAIPSDTYAIAWSGFEMTEILGARPVAFSVVNSSINYGMTQVHVQFSTVLVDTDNSWDMARSAFIAPVDGIYVLSVSSNVELTVISQLVLFVRGQLYNSSEPTKSVTYALHPQSSPCATSFSFTTVFSLLQNETVQLLCPKLAPNVDHSWDSFKGFLYAPFRARHNIIWSLDVQADENQTMLIEWACVQFANSTFTSQVSFTNTKRTHLIIPVDGIYYVTLTAQFCFQPSLCCTASLYANDKMLFKTNPLKHASIECFLHYRAVLLTLKQNDTLSVMLLEAETRIEVKIRSHNWIKLSGFLVQANETVHKTTLL